jgi:hypothetical protein
MVAFSLKKKIQKNSKTDSINIENIMRLCQIEIVAQCTL